MESNTLTTEIPIAGLLDPKATSVYLLDGDYALYLALGSTNQECEWDDGIVTPIADLPRAVEFLENWINLHLCTDRSQVVFCMSEGSNYRKLLVPSYKAHRTNKKPIGFYQLKKRVMARWASVESPHLEADDLIGILATCPELAERAVIMAEDKDFLTIPATRFNPRHRVFSRPTPAEARANLARQVLMGDTTDNYKGIPGVGPKTADKLLAGLEDPLAEIPRIYAAHGVSDWSDNIVCARILTQPWVTKTSGGWYVHLDEARLRSLEP